MCRVPGPVSTLGTERRNRKSRCVCHEDADGRGPSSKLIVREQQGKPHSRVSNKSKWGLDGVTLTCAGDTWESPADSAPCKGKPQSSSVQENKMWACPYDQNGV